MEEKEQNFDDRNIYKKRNYSPAPTPRRKKLIKNNLNAIYNTMSNGAYASQENDTQDKLLLFNDTSSILSSATNQTFLTNSNRYLFSASTMPTPRKPRKKSVDESAAIVKDNYIGEMSNDTSQIETMTKRQDINAIDYNFDPRNSNEINYYINNLIYGFRNYANSSSSSSSTTSSLADNHKLFKNKLSSLSGSNNSNYSKYNTQMSTEKLIMKHSTLQLDRTYNQLKRPTAPPPPLPKTPPPLIPPPSPTQYLIVDELNQSQSFFFANNQVTKVQGPPMTSTPHFSNTIKSTKTAHSRQSCERNLNFSSMTTKNCLKQKILAASRKNSKRDKLIGFEHFTNEILPSPSSISTTKRSKLSTLGKFMPKSMKILSYLEKLTFDSMVISIGVLVFLVCICFITLFQTQVHQFYQKFSNTSMLRSINETRNSTLKSSKNFNLSKDLEYFTAGSNLIKKTVLICNGPYFSYQMNNLMVLPFSLTLFIVFSCFSKRDKACIDSRKYKCISSCTKRPGLPSSLNPFQRRNRFLVAALFCILANEIFKMIESSLFNSTNQKSSSLNTTTNQFFNLGANTNNSVESSIRSSLFLKSSNSDFLRIGLGLEPAELIQNARNELANMAINSLNKFSSTSKRIMPTTSKPIFILAPSVLRYSKPKLPPRLSQDDFETEPSSTSTSTTPANMLAILNGQNKYDSGDLNLTLSLAENMQRARQARNQTHQIIESFNQTLNDSSSKTLFEVSMSLYHNEYVQSFVNKVFKSQFKWTLITDKLEKLALMMLEVLMIGLRYYPLIGVLDKNSLVCLFLATIYMWGDILYNVTLTGLCEGLRLNINLDLLKDLRRIFGVGFIFDAKEYLRSQHLKQTNHFLSKNIQANSFDSTSFDPMPIDAKLLFSSNRILYTIIKSLPHFFCLSYVTIKFTASLFKLFHKKITRKYSFMFPFSAKRASKDKSYEYLDRNLIVDSNLCKNYNLIYTRKMMQQHQIYVPTKENLANKISNIYSKMVVEKKPNQQTYLVKKYPLSFEDRYVKNLFKNIMPCSTSKLVPKFIRTHFDWMFDESFRFSTHVTCTFTVCFTVMYYLTCFVLFYGSIFVDMIYLPQIYKNSIVASSLVTSLICFVQLILSMKQFKTHLISLYKGTSQQYLSPKNVYSNRKIATGSFNYGGYAVTYTCWGYIILFVLLSFIFFQIATLIYFGSSTIGLFILVILVPFAISVLIMKLINRFICSFAAKYCFLQRNAKVLALKNLKVYSLFIYFKFFYDCFAGIAFCMIRMLTSMLLSIVFLPRLDYSFMGRSMEKMDHAFMSYIGFLHWEATHTNPIVICFCNLLIRYQKYRVKFRQTKSDMLRNRLRNRWYLFYLLSKNSQLIKYRRTKKCVI